jgi:hypothetical protein
VTQLFEAVVLAPGTQGQITITAAGSASRDVRPRICQSTGWWPPLPERSSMARRCKVGAAARANCHDY